MFLLCALSRKHELWGYVWRVITGSADLPRVATHLELMYSCMKDDKDARSHFTKAKRLKKLKVLKMKLAQFPEA